MNIWTALIEALVKGCGIVLALIWVREDGKKDEQAKQIKKDKELAEADARAWADSPRSLDDFTDRLHVLAAKKRKDRP